MSALGDRWAALQSRDRTIVVGVAALLVVVIVIAALTLTGGGGPEPFKAPQTAPTTRVTPRASATPTAVPQTFEVFEGKDPFEPLIQASGAPSPGATTSPGGSPPPSAQPTPGQRVSLLEIFTRSGVRYASVDVNGTEYAVKEDDRFATSYRVLSLSDRCGTFVFGDERFTLCVGQEVFK